MATAPASPCSHPTCPKLQPCPDHPVVPWRPRFNPPVHRIRGRKLQLMRARLFASYPWCVECAKAGRRTLATIRDHRIPLGEGGLDVEANTQGLCQSCSDVKTQAEALRGRGRA